MGTFSSELGSQIDKLSDQPRVYADANIPATLVTFMRQRLSWDVLFVLEHQDLRRARDIAHYRLARQLCRTLVTLDRDYCNDRRFPPAESGGVIVVSGPDERALATLLRRIDREIFRAAASAPDRPSEEAAGAPPLAGRKILATLDWPGNAG